MFVYGRNSVEEALKDEIPIKRVVIEKGKSNRFLSQIQRAKAKDVLVEYASEYELVKLAGTQKHQGIIAEISLPPTVYEKEEDFTDWEKLQYVLMLDGLTDTGNVGAIIRSALLLGVDVVVLPEDHSARITSQVIRASAGAIYKQPVLYVRNIVRTTEKLKSLGFTVYGLDMFGEGTLGEVTLQKPLCIVVGSEDKGMRRMMRKSCDQMIRIPTTGKLDSLNASVAVAICLWEVYKTQTGGRS
ncbi:23S rRNA (guanosine(2251)-2'-O)-methyltransferase RlmB [Thermospira aquatica]|uniref:23S rRNA (Guanosine(2251)-2'-O)-methyltransferase RlmB n=1 Tax=Thermospira aquatica TaxID=2828656 RepID=A0AAX3BA16_9SPIR|nr:23S rRNA (guanosine(2251)-2'-O)-methyltransferase RlmB [Thermospira aquatica]URA09097.1 23S rRNA (guanosine(2251)-2'-O)-methyltransferase RlmB [Thermospira aquatica]